MLHGNDAHWPDRVPMRDTDSFDGGVARAATPRGTPAAATRGLGVRLDGARAATWTGPETARATSTAPAGVGGHPVQPRPRARAGRAR